MKGPTYNSSEEKFIRENYATMSCKDIAAKLGRPLLSVYVYANRKGIQKIPGQRTWNKTMWTDQMDLFLRNNYQSMTNPQLAKALGLRMTVTRQRCHDLGLKKMDFDYWTHEQIDFLKSHYRNHGDVEIAALLEERFPKKKHWTKNHIHKKRYYLKLYRTKTEIAAIHKRDNSLGGRCCTIVKNSSSKNMADGWVANMIAWRDPELKKEVLKHPELIDLKRQSIILNRAIKGRKENAA